MYLVLIMFTAAADEVFRALKLPTLGTAVKDKAALALSKPHRWSARVTLHVLHSPGIGDR